MLDVGVPHTLLSAHREGETVLVVAHGGSLGMILAHLLQIDPRRPLPFSFGNASLSVIEVGPRRIHLVLMNDTCHLAWIGQERASPGDDAMSAS